LGKKLKGMDEEFLEKNWKRLNPIRTSNGVGKSFLWKVALGKRIWEAKT